MNSGDNRKSGPKEVQGLQCSEVEVVRQVGWLDLVFRRRAPGGSQSY